VNWTIVRATAHFESVRLAYRELLLLTPHDMRIIYV
jgi:hypothetical protein